MPRSGTTLMRAMIDRHPEIACGPEMRVIPALANFSAQTRRLCGDTLEAHYGFAAENLQKTFRNLVASFLEPYRQSRGKTRIAEKTPANVLHFDELNTLFPDADFIHVIRDGRDVVSSLLTMDWPDVRTGEPMAMTRDPAIAAATWARQVETGRAFKAAGCKIIEIRYEALVQNPRETLGEIFEFLDEPWCDAALTFQLGDEVQSGVAESSADQISKPLYLSSIGRWRRDLSDTAKAAVKKHAGPLLQTLDYAGHDDW